MVEEGLSEIIQSLKADPYAMETAWVSIIVFAGEAKTIVPLQEIVSFYPPKFPIGSGTSLSKGMGQLMFELRKNIVKTTFEQKGDWKPLVFLFTDGVPTEDSSKAIAEWRANWKATANLVAISIGDETDNNLLAQLTDNVLSFKNTSGKAYKQFFKWITDSIKTTSESVENNGSGFELAGVDGDVVSTIDLTKKQPAPRHTDSNFAVLPAKCSNTKRPYLIKYKRNLRESGLEGLGLATLRYKLVGAYQVDSSYEELSDGQGNVAKINSSELEGYPYCPSCGDPYGIAMCMCGKIHCIGEQEYNTCPWCNVQASYTAGDGDFDMGRAQG